MDFGCGRKRRKEHEYQHQWKRRDDDDDEKRREEGRYEEYDIRRRCERVFTPDGRVIAPEGYEKRCRVHDGLGRS